MNNGRRKMCTFCQKTLNKDDWDKTEEISRQMLNMLLPKLKLDISKENVICRECSSKLQNAVNFKSTCLSSESKILPRLNSEEDAKFVLKEDRQSENANVELINVSDDQNVCRFCKKLKENGCYSYSQEKKENIFIVDMVQMYIPELHLNVTEELITCKNCLDSLQSLLNFIITYSAVVETVEEGDDRVDVKVKLEPDDIQESILKKEVVEVVRNVKIEEKYAENEDVITVQDAVEYENFINIDNLNLNVKNEEIEIKPEENNSERYQENTNEDEILYRCETCIYETKRKDNLRRHMLIHKSHSEIKMYKCKICPFETKHKVSLTCHMLMHLNPSAFKCKICLIELKNQANLARHMLTHQNPSEIEMYQCESCSYQTKHKNCLIRHMLTHQKPSDLIMYKCDKCTFQTRHKGSHKYHMQTHQSPSERTVYKCESCSFESKVKYTYIRHMLIHERPSEVKMYKCEKCPFKTRHRHGISVHILTHQSASEVKMYYCEKCSFKTKYNGNLRQHLQTHESSPEIKKYKCEKCSYETRLRSSLIRHAQTHQNSSETEMVKKLVKKRNIGRLKKM